MSLIKFDYELDPFSAYLCVEHEYEYSLLFESNCRIRDTGDNSIIMFSPKMLLTYRNGITCIKEEGKERKIKKNILNLLDGLIKSKKPLDTGLTFDGGFAGYLSYDSGMEIMHVAGRNNPSYDIPAAFFGYYEDFILVDHKNNVTYINTDNIEIVEKLKKAASEIYPGNHTNDMEYDTGHNTRCDTISNTGCDTIFNTGFETGNNSGLISNFTEDEYKSKVGIVREYIRRGDVYQVNISQQFSSRGKFDPYSIYSHLRKANYGPYNAFLNINGVFILSSSPEQFIRKRGNTLTTRPIKGTIRKGADKAENIILCRELLNSEKNRSELLMIVDLERNDLSKICIPGTVEVECLFEVEEYSTVNHLVATVKGQLLNDANIKDIIESTFPGGSITGAPKLRTMEVIEELETVSRGIYTGSIGYISNNGDMEFNIAIRTAVVDGNGVYYNVGGGIVWDSDPEDEYRETLHKGKAICEILTKTVAGSRK